MSGRRARQFREAQATLAAIPPCECGSGWRVRDDGVLVITGHAMDCVALRAMGALSRAGRCSQCGYRLQIRTRGYTRRWWCQRGHQHGMSIKALTA